MCSEGAVIAAQFSRGNRMTSQDNQEYEVMLPHLPKGRIVFNTVFLHGDLRARPYRVEDFRDALAHLELLTEVDALGAFQMNHVWAVTFKNSVSMKKLLAMSNVSVKGRRCLVVDPNKQEVRVKVHWVLPCVNDDEVRDAFLPYGDVSEIAKERWRVHGIADKGSTTRVLSMKLKPGITIEDVPHQIRIAGEPALLVVAGRPPLCLRCQGKGHIRRDCRVPRCPRCRRFGHDENQCVPTYASMTGPARKSDVMELVMDETEAEETAAAATDTESPEKTRQESSTTKQYTMQNLTSEQETQQKPAAETLTGVTQPADNTSVSAPALEQCEGLGTNDTTMADASAAAMKRTHAEATEDTHVSEGVNADGPPAKAAPTRRLSFKPKPTVPPDKRMEMTPK